MMHFTYYFIIMDVFVAKSVCEQGANPEVWLQIWVRNWTSLELSVGDKLNSSVLQMHVKLLEVK